MKIYLSSPYFNEEDITATIAVENALSDIEGVSTYFPRVHSKRLDVNATPSDFSSVMNNDVFEVQKAIYSSGIPIPEILVC